jgi:hypothetical protein
MAVELMEVDVLAVVLVLVLVVGEEGMAICRRVASSSYD